MSTTKPKLVHADMDRFLVHHDLALGILTKRLRDRSAAEDVLQEAFLRLQTRTEGKEIASPAAFLVRTALNIAYDRMRSVKRRQEHELQWVQSNQETHESSLSTPVGERSLAAKQELALLARSLEALAPSVRNAFILHKVNGLTHAETASRLGLSRSTVEKHIMKAMRHLCASYMDRGQQ